MTEMHMGHSEGLPGPGGKKLSPKLLIGVAGVVLVLLVLRARGKSAATAASPSPAVGSTDSTGTLGDAEAAMMAALQADNAATIAAQLALIPAGATGPIGKQGLTGPAGKPGKVPTGTVHVPAAKPAGGGSGVPVAHGYFYTVLAGDTLSGIAAKKHVANWRSLINPRTSAAVDAHPNLIHPGDRVWIPTT